MTQDERWNTDGSWLKVNGNLWFMVKGSIVVQGEWQLMVHGSR